MSELHPGFKRGQKLLCLTDWTPTRLAMGINTPIQGDVYTCRALIGPTVYAPYWAVLLDEVKNPVEEGAIHEPAFRADNFEGVSLQ